MVVVNGQTYVTAYGDPSHEIDESQVGDVVAVVACRIADVGDPDFEPREGDAAYLAAGTELREVQGQSSDEVLTAFEEGVWQVFMHVDS